MISKGNITLGGAIGTGSHGSTIRYNASISSQVVGLTIVDGKGRVRTITDSKDLRAFRLNLGLLGKKCYGDTQCSKSAKSVESRNKNCCGQK